MTRLLIQILTGRYQLTNRIVNPYQHKGEEYTIGHRLNYVCIFSVELVLYVLPRLFHRLLAVISNQTGKPLEGLGYSKPKEKT